MREPQGLKLLRRSHAFRLVALAGVLVSAPWASSSSPGASAAAGYRTAAKFGACGKGAYRVVVFERAAAGLNATAPRTSTGHYELRRLTPAGAACIETVLDDRPLSAASSWQESRDMSAAHLDAPSVLGRILIDWTAVGPSGLGGDPPSTSTSPLSQAAEVVVERPAAATGSIGSVVPRKVAKSASLRLGTWESLAGS